MKAIKRSVVYIIDRVWLQRQVLILLLLPGYFSCSEKKEYGLEKKWDKVYALNDSYSRAKYCNNQFGAQLVEVDSIPYIVYLDSAHHLVYNSLPGEPAVQFEIDISKIITRLSWFSARFSGEELFVLDISNRVLERYSFVGKTFVLDHTYRFDSLFNWTPYSTSSQYNNSFEVYYPYLYIPYSIHDPSTYYLDTAKYFLFKFRDADSSVSNEGKVLFVPDLLKKGRLRFTHSTLNRINDTVFQYAFGQYDSIYLYDPRINAITVRAEFERNSSYLRFKKSKAYNLAYSRWYDETNERNSHILTNPNGSTLIIKKQRKKKIKDKNMYEYYFLDTQLQVIYHRRFPVAVNPMFSFGYKRGFFVFSEDLSSCFYYEI